MENERLIIEHAEIYRALRANAESHERAMQDADEWMKGMLSLCYPGAGTRSWKQVDGRWVRYIEEERSDE